MTALAGTSVLITGHTGFKGSWLALWLLARGATVSGFALPPQGAPSLFSQLGLAREMRNRHGDLRDRDAVAAAVDEARPEIVFHLAAQSLVLDGYRDPLATFATNVMGTAHLLDALMRRDAPCRVVVVTTDKVYENTDGAQPFAETDPLGGHDPYSASKAACEIVSHAYRRSFLEARGIRLATARAGNVIGGGDWAADRLVPDLVRALKARQPARIRNPLSVRPWQHVFEPLQGYIALAEALGEPHPAPDAVNFGPCSSAFRPVRDVVEHALGAWPDPHAGWIDARSNDAPHEAARLTLSIDRARDRLNWRPRLSFAQAIETTMAWYHASLGARPQDLRDRSMADLRRFEAA